MPLSKWNLDETKQRINAKKEDKGLAKQLHPLLGNLGDKILENPNRKKTTRLEVINPYLDQSTVGTVRRKRKFELSEPGKYVAQAEVYRGKRQRLNEEEEVRKKKENRGLLADTLTESGYVQLVPPPWVEWWDRGYFKQSKYENIKDIVVDSEDAPITKYIHHPVLVQPVWENPVASKVFLTKEERKRQRRLVREARHKLQQDRIRLGLDSAPPPKVKLQNFMNVLTNEASSNPTALENKVRAQMAARIEKHEADNEARKLTKEEKAIKIHDRHQRDIDRGKSCAVFRIDNFGNPKHVFKVDMNAKQQELVGFCIQSSEFTMVLVEGGNKMVRYFCHLMMNRIKWSEHKASCRLVWQGDITELHYKKWSMLHPRAEELAELLNRFKLQGYWRQAAT